MVKDGSALLFLLGATVVECTSFAHIFQKSLCLLKAIDPLQKRKAQNLLQSLPNRTGSGLPRVRVDSLGTWARRGFLQCIIIAAALRISLSVVSTLATKRQLESTTPTAPSTLSHLAGWLRNVHRLLPSLVIMTAFLFICANWMEIIITHPIQGVPRKRASPTWIRSINVIGYSLFVFIAVLDCALCLLASYHELFRCGFMLTGCMYMVLAVVWIYNGSTLIHLLGEDRLPLLSGHNRVSLAPPPTYWWREILLINSSGFSNEIKVKRLVHVCGCLWFVKAFFLLYVPWKGNGFCPFVKSSNFGLQSSRRAVWDTSTYIVTEYLPVYVMLNSMER